jgi:hypothetical protein
VPEWTGKGPLTHLGRRSVAAVTIELVRSTLGLGCIGTVATSKFDARTSGEAVFFATVREELVGELRRESETSAWHNLAPYGAEGSHLLLDEAIDQIQSLFDLGESVRVREAVFVGIPLLEAHLEKLHALRVRSCSLLLSVAPYCARRGQKDPPGSMARQS